MILQPAERMARGPKQGSRGFTLIELMVTVAILAIMTALAVTSIGPMVLRVKLGEGAEQVRAAVAFARAEARASGRCTKVDVVADLMGPLAAKPAVVPGHPGTGLRVWRWKDVLCAGATSAATAEVVGSYPLPEGVVARLAGAELVWQGNGRAPGTPPLFQVDSSAGGASGAQTVLAAVQGPVCAFPTGSVGSCP